MTDPGRPPPGGTVPAVVSYLALLRRRWHDLVFGFCYIFLSAPGQTFFLAVFGPSLRQSFSLSDGQFGGLYAASTCCSALAFALLGGLLDHVAPRGYARSVLACVATGCVLAAIGSSVAALFVAMVLLRLGGQSLMIHVAMTATARAFRTDTGKALALVFLGLSLSQALTPFAAVAMLESAGWRPTLALAAVLVLGAGMLVVNMCPAAPGPAEAPRPDPVRGRRSFGPVDARLATALPVVVSASFISTGFIFHQGRLAQENGWSPAWVAGWFVAFAAGQAVSQLAAGPVIDRVGACRLLSLFMLPMALAMSILATSKSPTVLPPCLALMGLSNGAAPVLGTALWVELFGPGRIGRVRAIAEAGNVVASGLAPLALGARIDLGVDLRLQAAGCLAYLLGASCLALHVRRKDVSGRGAA